MNDLQTYISLDELIARTRYPKIYLQKLLHGISQNYQILWRNKTSLRLSKDISFGRLQKQNPNCLKSYDWKLKFAKKSIRKIIEKHGKKTYVACSFGRDSMVILYLALQVDPEIAVVFENTKVQNKLTYEFRDRMKKEWNLNLFETFPIKDFWVCANEFGLPNVKNKKGDRSGAQCCRYMKELPAQILQKEKGWTAVIVGERMAENHNRMLAINRWGTSRYVISAKIVKEKSIAYWLDRDIETFHIQNNIPENPIYQSRNRTGCDPCTSYSSWKKNLSGLKPKLFIVLMKKHKQSNLYQYSPCMGTRNTKKTENV